MQTLLIWGTMHLRYSGMTLLMDAGAGAREVLLTSVSNSEGSWGQIKSALLIEISRCFPLLVHSCGALLECADQTSFPIRYSWRAVKHTSAITGHPLWTEYSKSKVKLWLPKFNDEFRSMLPSVPLNRFTFTVLYYYCIQGDYEFFGFLFFLMLLCFTFQ